MSGGDNPTRSQAKALEVVEVVGERERHTGSSSAERGVGHDVSIELLDERDARIFDAPQLLGISLGIRKERPVHRQHERVHLRQRCRQRIGEVCRECGDAALARQVIAEERDAADISLFGHPAITAARRGGSIMCQRATTSLGSTNSNV